METQVLRSHSISIFLLLLISNTVLPSTAVIQQSSKLWQFSFIYCHAKWNDTIFLFVLITWIHGNTSEMNVHECRIEIDRALDLIYSIGGCRFSGAIYFNDHNTNARAVNLLKLLIAVSFACSTHKGQFSMHPKGCGGKSAGTQLRNHVAELIFPSFSLEARANCVAFMLLMAN